MLHYFIVLQCITFYYIVMHCITFVIHFYSAYYIVIQIFYYDVMYCIVLHRAYCVVMYCVTFAMWRRSMSVESRFDSVASAKWAELGAPTIRFPSTSDSLHTTSGRQDRRSDGEGAANPESSHLATTHSCPKSQT